MKRIAILLSLATSIGVGYCQETEMWSNVPILLDAYGHKVSPDGAFSTGEAVSAESAWARNNITGEIYFFDGASCGEGNNITKDNLIVGTDKVYMKAAFLKPGESIDPVLIPSLSKYSESYAHGINWDGTRLVGVMVNPRSGNADEVNPEYQHMSYLPFYCNIDPETNTVEDPKFLPVPPRDFFGLVPQYCTATWISDDATTILGQVIDNSGYYIYPIVYKQDAAGEWSYILPSEPLFNPNGLEIPHWPLPEMEQPLPVNYIENAELKALYQNMLDEFIAGVSDINPDELLDPNVAGTDALMNQKEWNAYQNALEEYKEYYDNVYEEELNKYYDQYSRFIAQSSNFLQSSMAMNRAGTLIGQTKMVTRFSGINPITYAYPVIFNLEDGSYKIYGDELSELEISQILPDGTLLATSPKPGPTTPDLTPQHSYVCAPGSSTFVAIENYIKSTNPEYYNWYMEYLYHKVPIGYEDATEEEDGNIAYKQMTVTGLVAVSDDFTTLSGGVDGWSWDYDAGNYFTYIFTNMTTPDTGVENIKINPNTGLKVYNLQGVKVLETKDAASLKALAPGIYIINGKKVII
ncbi:MAG: hypothetical protein J1E16_06750 [Muribaculaceae bacterium]|nr:hypothetical protein [Muribaculaceae bacterium]